MTRQKILELTKGLNLNAEQTVLLQFILQNKFNGKIEPSSCDYLFYQGLIAGSEFLTYNVNKIYIAFLFQLSPLSVRYDTNFEGLEIYDNNDVINYFLTKSNLAYSPVEGDIVNSYQNVKINNIYFSRIALFNPTINYGYINFNGLRITY